MAWEYLKDFTRDIRRTPPNESELRIDLINGSRISLFGADNADALRGLGFSGAIMDEHADMAPSVWSAVVRPTLADRSGWVVFIGTPKAHNQFWEIYREAVTDLDRWYSSLLKASETGILPQAELDDARRTMTPEAYEAEFECSFEAAILGAYFGKELAEAEAAGRVKETLELEPGLPIHTSWDLGLGDHCAIWCFQLVAGEIRVIDFLQDHGHSMERYCADLDARHYHGTDYVPQDARAKSLETGRTRVETLVALGRKPQLVPAHKIDDGIQATRLTFPRLWFDRSKCKDGLEALAQYRCDFDEKLKTFKPHPRHDWTSHAADAMRYLAMAWRELLGGSEPIPPPDLRPLEEWTYDEFSPLALAREDIEDARRRERRMRV